MNINLNKIENHFRHLAKLSGVRFCHISQRNLRIEVNGLKTEHHAVDDIEYIVQLDSNGCVFDEKKLDNRIDRLCDRFKRQYGEDFFLTVYMYQNGYENAPTLFTEDMAKEGDDFLWKIHYIDGDEAGIGTDVWIKTKYPTENVADLGTPRIYLGTNPEIKYALSIEENPRLLDDVLETDTGLTPRTMQRVKQWVITYQEPLMAYWRGEIDTIDVIKAICPYKVFIDDDDSDGFE